MSNEQYIEYLKSDKWQKIRQKVAKKHNYICEGCGKVCKYRKSLYGFQVHHTTYEHIFNESKHLGDLRFLCEDCHKLVTKEKISFSRKRGS